MTAKRMKLTIPKEELMNPGHQACQGCGATLAMRFALKALGKNTILTVPACCWTVIAGPFPYSAVQIPFFHTAFETAGAAASGIKAALEIKGNSETTVLAWAGDGGTMDIGLQALSGAVERGDNFIYVCYDNEAYMNTGIQRSSSTPYGAWTTTTPAGFLKARPKKDIVEIMVAHGISYTATASVAYPEDFIEKLRKAKTFSGTKFIHLLAPCPVGWRFSPENTILLGRLAVEAKIFPLYEVEEGKYKIKKITSTEALNEYLKLQGRFKYISDEQIAEIKNQIDSRYERLLKKEKIF